MFFKLLNINQLITALSIGLLVSCGEVQKNSDIVAIANSSCVLKIEGLFCEKEKDTSLELELQVIEGVIACNVDCPKKKVEIDFDNTTLSTENLIKEVKTISNKRFEITFLEEKVFVPVKNSGTLKEGLEESDEVSVSDFRFSLPDFSSFFSNFI